MFSPLLAELQRNVVSVKRTLQTSEQTRLALQSTLPASTPLELVRQVAPDSAAWRVYDHCSAVTRLYALYEGFVDDIVSEWLASLPKLFPNYLDLPENVRVRHRQGVGELLREIEASRYSALNPKDIIQGFYSGITGSLSYELYAHAFLKRRQNLRKEVLEQMLTSAGIGDSWKWVDSHPNITAFLSVSIGNANTLEGELNALLDYRNEAAHGHEIGAILDVKGLLSIADFILALCGALAELVTNHTIERKLAVQQARRIGPVTEVFKKSDAVIVKAQDCRLAVGDRFYVCSHSSCRMASLLSIQINNVSTGSREIVGAEEVGLRFDILPPKNAMLVALT